MFNRLEQLNERIITVLDTLDYLIKLGVIKISK